MDLYLTVLFSALGALFGGAAIFMWWKPEVMWATLHRLYRARK